MSRLGGCWQQGKIGEKGWWNTSKNPSGTRDRKVKRQALKYTMIDEKLFRRSIEGSLLRCLSEEEAKVAMGEVHEGLCGTHQSAHKMCWTMKRVGVYWTTMLTDCFKYHKGCEACQKFGVVQAVPASVLHPIIKHCPFRAWGLDFIREIHPSSTKGHRFVVVATDYFTKWVKALPLRKMTQRFDKICDELHCL
jgi:hypothetical protein